MEDNVVLIKDLLKIQENVEFIQGAFDYKISSCSTNTKIIKEGDAFFAIDKGNEHIKEALEKGATCCIVEKTIESSILEEYSEVTFVKVKSALEALQNLAIYKRSLYDIPVIAVTGSVGKTSTKDIIASVVSRKYNVLKTQGNFNNHIGLPLTILNLKNHTAMVLEMGMNHFHEIERLSEIARPNIAVITNIGTSHIGILGSQRNIMKAKLEVLKGLQEGGTLIINNDNELLKEWNDKENKSKSFNVITYSISENSDVKANNIKQEENYSTYNVVSSKINGEIEVQIAGEHFIYNSLAGISVANVLNMEYEDAKTGILEFELTKKRMEIKEYNGVKYINDAYNASFESMKYAIKNLDAFNGKRKIAVLGDMFELGSYTEELHRKVGEEINKSNIDILITAGEYSKYIANEVNNVKVKIHVKNKDEVIEEIKKISQTGDVILLKASNGMKFFEILDGLL